MVFLRGEEVRKRLLWVGDACCPSGFARSTHAVCDVLNETYDVTVLGINFNGDPHAYSYPVYAAAVAGDFLGVERLVWMCDVVKPDVIVLQNDFWNIPPYVRKLKLFKDTTSIPRVGYIAIDGKNVIGQTLEDLDLAVFWTRFAEAEAREGGFTKLSAVVPLGVDTMVYSPGDQVEARGRIGIKREYAEHMFIVGNVNRNQPRKRMDLTVRYFAEWVRSHRVDDAYLFIHTAPTGDQGFDVEALANYYGVHGRLITRNPQVFYGAPEETMRDTYRAFDVMLTTTQGEGFGLTPFEAMACGVPVIAPDWSALGELLKDSAWLVPCTSTAATIGGSVIGGVPDEEETVKGLNTLYRDRGLRAELTAKGLETVNRPEYRWRRVGEAFRDVMARALVERMVAA